MRLFVIVPLLALGCAGAGLAEVEELLARDAGQPRPARDSLAAYVDDAARDHPRVGEARARAEAALARARGASSLDDPMLFFRAEGVPLRTPGGLNRDEFNAAGLSQAIPLFKQGLRQEAAVADARRAFEDWRRAAAEVAAEVRKVSAEYFAALREEEIHTQHVELMRTFVSVAETKYAAGKVSQQDVLEGRSGTTMLHVALSETSSKLEEARAALRDLTGRDAPPPSPARRGTPPTREEVATRALSNHPLLAAARQGVRRAEAALRLAERERWAPDLSADLMVMQMPDEPDAWGGTLGFTLPWFSPKRRAEAEAAGRELEAERRGLEAAERSVHREVRSSYARLTAALRSRALFEEDLLPRARQTLEVARSNYEKEKIDFLRFLEAEQELRRVELEAAQAEARAEAAWAELDRAAGTMIGGAP